jgi:hypothetical protein
MLTTEKELTSVYLILTGVFKGNLLL